MLNNFKNTVVESDNQKLILSASLTCLLTTVLVFILSNIILLKYDVFIASAHFVVTALLIQCSIFYMALLFNDISMSTVSVVAVLAIVGFYHNEFILFILILSACLCSVAYIVRVNKCIESILTKDLVRSALVGAVVIVSAKAPVSFDMLDRLIDGTIHRDTLYHASIASMIKSYGVVSTGLSGLIETPYHILSHAIMAGVSVLSDMSVLEAYGVIPYTLFLPLLITLFTYVSSTECNNMHFSRLYVFTALILAITPRLLNSWGLKESYFGSESYSVGLILLSCFLLLLLKNYLTIKNMITIFFIAFLAAGAKVSVGLAVIGLLIARIVFFSRKRKLVMRELLLLIMSLMTVIYILLPTASSYADDVIHKVGYWESVTHNSMLGEWVIKGGLWAIVPIAMFLFLHFIVSWVVIKSRMGELSVGKLISDKAFVYSLLAVIGSVIIVWLPLIYMSDGYYFSSIAMFVSLPWFVIILSKKNYSKIVYPTLTAVLIVLVFKHPKLIGKSFIERGVPRDSRHFEFVEELLASKSDNRMLIYKRDYGESWHEYNPIKDCMRAPFVYSAVSEKAWLDVIFTDCDMQSYGYNFYIDADSGADGIKKKIPADFSIKTI